MTCPKCDEGTIIKIRFKKSGDGAYLCDFCEALWFEGEDIKSATVHTLRTYKDGTELDYTIEEFHDKDWEHRPARHTSYK